MMLKNKTVWITGASSGIGEALAYEWAKRKCNLILSALTEDSLLPLKDKCEQEYHVFVHIEAFNLDSPEEIEKAANNVFQKFPKVDVMINNGGISQRSLVTETSLEIDHKIMQIDYFSAVQLTKLVLPKMIENGGGYISATSSISGKFGFPLRSAYSAAKHALFGFFETVYLENKQHNIHVTIAIPGRVQTNISLHALNKEGKAHGKMDDGQNEGITAESCAKQYIRAIEKNKVQVLIGGKELLMVYIKKFLPKVFYKLATKIKPT